MTVLCAVGALLLTARLGGKWSGDRLSGAALPLGLLLFPPAAFAFAQPALSAVVAVLTIIGLTLVSLPNERLRPATWLAVVVISVALTKSDLSGSGIAAGLLFIAAMRPDVNRYAQAAIVVLLLGVVSLGLNTTYDSFGPTEDTLGLEDAITVSILIPYAMLWVALAFAVLALTLSKALRDHMTEDAFSRSVHVALAFAIALAWTLLHPQLDTANAVFAMSSLLTLGVMAALPMVLWIRFVMPQLRSMLVWILLPVIMYSCFWVILGPIDLDGFPYDRLDL